MEKEQNMGWCEWLTAWDQPKAGMGGRCAGNVKEMSFISCVTYLSTLALMPTRTA